MRAELPSPGTPYDRACQWRTGQRVGEARSHVQEGQRRAARHSPVAVRRARADSFVKAEHGPDGAVQPVQRGHQVPLGGACMQVKRGARAEATITVRADLVRAERRSDGAVQLIEIAATR